MYCLRYFSSSNFLKDGSDAVLPPAEKGGACADKSRPDFKLCSCTDGSSFRRNNNKHHRSNGKTNQNLEQGNRSGRNRMGYYKQRKW